MSSRALVSRSAVELAVDLIHAAVVERDVAIALGFEGAGESGRPPCEASGASSTKLATPAGESFRPGGGGDRGGRPSRAARLHACQASPIGAAVEDVAATRERPQSRAEPAHQPTDQLAGVALRASPTRSTVIQRYALLGARAVAERCTSWLSSRMRTMPAVRNRTSRKTSVNEAHATHSGQAAADPSSRADRPGLSVTEGAAAAARPRKSRSGSSDASHAKNNPSGGQHELDQAAQAEPEGGHHVLGSQQPPAGRRRQHLIKCRPSTASTRPRLSGDTMSAPSCRASAMASSPCPR